MATFYFMYLIFSGTIFAADGEKQNKYLKYILMEQSLSTFHFALLTIKLKVILGPAKNAVEDEEKCGGKYYNTILFWILVDILPTI